MGFSLMGPGESRGSSLAGTIFGDILFLETLLFKRLWNQVRLYAYDRYHVLSSKTGIRVALDILIFVKTRSSPAVFAVTNSKYSFMHTNSCEKNPDLLHKGISLRGGSQNTVSCKAFLILSA